MGKAGACLTTDHSTISYVLFSNMTMEGAEVKCVHALPGKILEVVVPHCVRWVPIISGGASRERVSQRTGATTAAALKGFPWPSVL